MTLISVLVPVLNEERRIASAIASILAQPGVDVEVLRDSRGNIVIVGGEGHTEGEIVGRLSALRRRITDDMGVLVPWVEVSVPLPLAPLSALEFHTVIPESCAKVPSSCTCRPKKATVDSSCVP